MKREVLTLIDYQGNTKDKSGSVYGFFLSDEKDLCEAFCNENHLKYRKDTVNIEG